MYDSSELKNGQLLTKARKMSKDKSEAFQLGKVVAQTEKQKETNEQDAMFNLQQKQLIAEQQMEVRMLTQNLRLAIEGLQQQPSLAGMSLQGAAPLPAPPPSMPGDVTGMGMPPTDPNALPVPPDQAMGAPPPAGISQGMM